MRQGVVIYNEWAPLLKRLPDALRGLVFSAILDYSETGEQTETGDPAADMLLAMIYQQVGKDMQKYQDKCDQMRANASKSKQMQADATKSKQMQPNRDNINKNININIKLKEKDTLTRIEKESAAEAATRTPTRHDKFMEWLAENCPYIAGHYKLPSAELLEKLIAKYGAEAVADECMSIENRADIRRRYTNLYQTLNNWLKRDYGEDRRTDKGDGGRAERAEAFARRIRELAAEDDRRRGA